jgi:hypothetical protein
MFKNILESSTFIMLIFLQIVIGQTKSESDTTDFTLKEFSTHSIQFQIGGLLNLSSFQGTLISYKYQVSDNFGFRFGIGIIFDDNKNDIDEKYTTTANPDSHLSQINSSDNNYRYILLSQFIYYFNPLKKIKSYAGVGPYFSYNSLINDQNKIIYVTSEYEYEENNKRDAFTYQIGISAAYGFEWFFYDNMSLIAEYGLLFFYYKTETKDTNQTILTEPMVLTQTRDRKIDGWRFEDSKVKLGLSIYF